MAKIEITADIEPAAPPVFEPFVFDKNDPDIQWLISNGVPESRLKTLSDDYAAEAEDLGEEIAHATVVEKRR